MQSRSFSIVGLGALALVFAHFLSASPAVGGSTECPASTVWYFQHGHGGYYTVDSFTYDTHFSTDGYDSAYVSFDRNEARLSLSAIGAMSAGVRVVERFDVVGVPPGTSLDATVVLRLDGGVLQNCGGSGCSMRFGGTLASGADSVSAIASLNGPCGGCHRDIDTTLVLPVTLVAGTPLEAAFTLQYGTTWVGWGEAQANGIYGIAGLPPGVRAIACPGADVTPVRRSTWGGVKTLYR